MCAKNEQRPIRNGSDEVIILTTERVAYKE